MEKAFDNFEKIVISNGFICENCGKIIYPKITIDKHGILVESNYSTITGGLGNKILKDHICLDCEEKLRLLKFKN